MPHFTPGCTTLPVLSFAGSGVVNQVIHLFLASTSAKNCQWREPQLSQTLLKSAEDSTSNGGGGTLSCVQSNWGQIIAITDLCDDLTGTIVFVILVNEVHANEVDRLAVVGFGHHCLTLTAT